MKNLLLAFITCLLLLAGCSKCEQPCITVDQHQVCLGMSKQEFEALPIDRSSNDDSVEPPYSADASYTSTCFRGGKIAAFCGFCFVDDRLVLMEVMADAPEVDRDSAYITHTLMREKGTDTTCAGVPAKLLSEYADCYHQGCALVLTNAAHSNFLLVETDHEGMLH